VTRDTASQATRRTGGEVPGGVLSVECDITDQAQVDAAFEAVEAELGAVGVLVANAGVTKDNLLARMSDADWDTVIDTNLTGTFRVVRRAARPMTRARFGRIILISSVVGVLGSPGQVNYSASKSALIGMARSLTRELGARGYPRQRDRTWFHRDRHDRGTGRKGRQGIPGADPGSTSWSG